MLHQNLLAQLISGLNITRIAHAVCYASFILAPKATGWNDLEEGAGRCDAAVDDRNGRFGDGAEGGSVHGVGNNW